AGQQLDQARPGARELMRSALRYDPDMQRSMTELSGRERVGQVIGRLGHERAMQADPNVRADRFVERWQELSRQRQQLRGWQHDEARGKVEGQMQGLARSLERDPQVESILRNRRQEIGIGQHMRQSEGISRELQQSLTRGRSLGLER
ncbi:MAG: Ti-type conjugative transfer relaxase TraA, partial [Pseudaminobacter sp.]